jgi:hypothetical protein
LEHNVTFPGQNPEDAAQQARDAEIDERDREAYERYKASHPELSQSGQGQPAESQPEEPQKREDEFSHYLVLANGDSVKYDAADGPVPTDVNGVPVASVYPAAVGGPT